MTNFKIHTASITDIAFMLNCAKAEGWNPGKNDAILFHLTDPNGFLVGQLDNQIIAMISAARYNNQFGFIGLYIVSPQFRNQGYGLQIWRAGLSYLDGCNIGLDGVVAQQDNYKKSGFKLAHRNIRYGGQPFNAIASKLLVDARTIRFDNICEYDNQLFPAFRPAFLSSWLSTPEHCSLAVIQKGKIMGYGVIRPCLEEGFKIGPLFADNEKIADEIFVGLCSQVKRGPIFIDIPELNPFAKQLVERYCFSPVFETARMYTRSEPAVDTQRVFGITTLELG